MHFSALAASVPCSNPYVLLYIPVLRAVLPRFHEKFAIFNEP